MTELSKIDVEQHLYVYAIYYTNGKKKGRLAGYSCLGFDYTRKLSDRIADWLGMPHPDPTVFGSEAGWNTYQELLAKGAEKHRLTGERCPADLELQLIGLEGARVEVEHEWGEVERFWVGISTGWMPCHLAVPTIRSSGGPAVLGPFKRITVLYRSRSEYLRKAA